MKIKCVKIECPICGKDGSLQVFFNKQNKIKYARTRHYTGLKNKKPQFTYCKLEDLSQLETLLFSLNFHFPTEASRKLGHKIVDQTGNCIKIGHRDLSSNLIIAGGVGFEPTTPNLGGWCSIRTEHRERVQFRLSLLAQISRPAITLDYRML